MGKFTRAFTATLFVGATLVTAAFAGDGQVNAVSFRKLDTSTSLTVSPLDNSDESMVLKEDFEQALKNAGFSISPNSHLVLTFEVRDDLGTWGGQDRRSVVELTNQGAWNGGDDTLAKLNLYNSSRGGLINQGDQHQGEGTKSKYRLEVTLDDRQEKRRVWQGWAVTEVNSGDKQSLTRGMVPFLAKSVGQTVRKETFTIK